MKTCKNSRDKVTISSFCRNMILDGATNEEVFEALQDKYGRERFNEDKALYPSWYRCELRRHGKLPPAFDYINHESTAVHMFED